MENTFGILSEIISLDIGEKVWKLSDLKKSMYHSYSLLLSRLMAFSTFYALKFFQKIIISAEERILLDSFQK
jgi:hypothetical protein